MQSWCHKNSQAYQMWVCLTLKRVSSSFTQTAKNYSAKLFLEHSLKTKRHCLSKHLTLKWHLGSLNVILRIKELSFNAALHSSEMMQIAVMITGVIFNNRISSQLDRKERISFSVISNWLFNIIKKKTKKTPTQFPVVIGALGAVNRELAKWLHQIPGTTSETSVQKSTVLGQQRYCRGPSSSQASGKGPKL